MDLKQAALIERRIIAVLVLWLLFGCALALTWADWFVPSSAVFFASAFISVVVTATIWWRKGDKLRKAFTVSGCVGLLGMTALTFWLGFAQSLPALITFAIGVEHTFEAKVVSYGLDSDTCKFRIVIDGLAPPNGGFCRAGATLNSFTSGESVSVAARYSLLGVHVLNFAPAKIDEAYIDAPQSQGNIR